MPTDVRRTYFQRVKSKSSIWHPPKLDKGSSFYQGLSLHLPFIPDGSGTIDLVSNGLVRGVFNNIHPSDFIQSPYGPAVRFSNGRQSYISIADNGSVYPRLDFEASPGFTVSAWIYTKVPTANATIVGRYPNASVFDRQFILKRSNTDIAIFEVYDTIGASMSAISDGTRVPVASGQWVNLLGRVSYFQSTTNDTYCDIYINGRQQNRFTGTSYKPIANNALQPIIIGGGTGATNDSFDGYIANVSIWKRPLTDKEIWALYQNPHALYQRSITPMVLGGIQEVSSLDLSVFGHLPSSGDLPLSITGNANINTTNSLNLSVEADPSNSMNLTVFGNTVEDTIKMLDLFALGGPSGERYMTGKLGHQFSTPGNILLGGDGFGYESSNSLGFFTYGSTDGLNFKTMNLYTDGHITIDSNVDFVMRGYVSSEVDFDYTGLLGSRNSAKGNIILGESANFGDINSNSLGLNIFGSSSSGTFNLMSMSIGGHLSTNGDLTAFQRGFYSTPAGPTIVTGRLGWAQRSFLGNIMLGADPLFVPISSAYQPPSLYVAGSEGTSEVKQFNLYTHGTPNSGDNSISLYVYGVSNIRSLTMAIPYIIPGRMSGFLNNFIYGHQTVSGGMNMFLKTIDPVSRAAGTHMFITGSTFGASGVWNTSSLFTKGDGGSTSMNLFVEGVDTGSVLATMPLSLKGRGYPTENSVNLYLHQQEMVGGLDLYVLGRGLQELPSDIAVELIKPFIPYTGDPGISMFIKCPISLGLDMVLRGPPETGYESMTMFITSADVFTGSTTFAMPNVIGNYTGNLTLFTRGF